jgi:hypothetical protein
MEQLAQLHPITQAIVPVAIATILCAFFYMVAKVSELD